MRIGLLTSNRGSSPLVYGIREHIPGLEDYQVGGRYDLVLVFNQTAHTRDYEYPEFPRDDVPVAFIDTAEYGTSGRPWNAFQMEHDTKNSLQQGRMRHFLAGRSFPYFIREMWLDRYYPAAYHPIDYPLASVAVCTRRPDRDEYMRRTVDVACIWGMSNAARVPITAEIRSAPVRSDVYAVDVDGPRIEQGEYWRRLEAARCTVSSDGYGSSSFRVTEALVRTALLMTPLRIHQRKPLIDGETCVKYDVSRLGEDHFNVYAAGYDHCMTHYTCEATAQYIMDTIKQHDWSVPTWI